MNDNYVITFEGKEFEVNDPYFIVSREMVLDSLPEIKKNIKDNEYEKKLFETADLLVIGADGGLLLCKVTAKKSTKEFVYMLNDKYEPRNKNHLARWKYSEE